ncbi:hypothetical protein CAF53_19500 [Sphingobium sp. LB126]|nr:hypothetical protein CAF53_19500 [Sphingobium sp. LB126]
MRPMASRPDGRGNYMTITGIETFVCDIENAPQMARVFKDGGTGRALDRITHGQAPAEAAIGHD